MTLIAEIMASAEMRELRRTQDALCRAEAELAVLRERQEMTRAWLQQQARLLALIET